MASYIAEGIWDGAKEVAYRSVHPFRGEEMNDTEMYSLNISQTLDLEDYLKYRTELDEARRSVKGDYERQRATELKLKADLLSKFDKLYKFLLNKEEERKKREAEKAQKASSQGFLESGFGAVVSAADDDEAEKELDRKLEMDTYEERLMEQLKKLQQDHKEAALKTEELNNALANFLQDQGKVIATVEQAEAFDAKLQRKKARTQAFKDIVDALRGWARKEQDPETGLDNMRDMRDREDSDEIKAVEVELQKLEQLEAATDQFVDRLRVKLDSVDLLEESQVEMVELQVRKHRKTLTRVQDLEGAVIKNNADIKLLTLQMQSELSTKLDGIVGGSVQKYLFVLIGFIFIAVGFVACFYAYKLLSGL